MSIEHIQKTSQTKAIEIISESDIRTERQNKFFDNEKPNSKVNDIINPDQFF